MKILSIVPPGEISLDSPLPEKWLSKSSQEEFYVFNTIVQASPYFLSIKSSLIDDSCFFSIMGFECKLFLNVNKWHRYLKQNISICLVLFPIWCLKPYFGGNCLVSKEAKENDYLEECVPRRRALAMGNLPNIAVDSNGAPGSLSFHSVAPES